LNPGQLIVGAGFFMFSRHENKGGIYTQLAPAFRQTEGEEQELKKEPL
jgi:hypothetical protein